MKKIDITPLIRDTLERKKEFRIRGEGFSMHPSIKNRDVITIAPFLSGRIAWGEVVAFMDSLTGRLAVHRVLFRRGNSYLLKGDHLPHADGFIPRDRILGYLKNVERNGKNISLRTGWKKYFWIFLSGWCLFCYEVLQRAGFPNVSLKGRPERWFLDSSDQF